jgi:hypothetical protein
MENSHTGNGVNRNQRGLPMLDPSNVLLDDRTLEDLLYFASQMAGELNFYDTNGNISGNWSKFLAEIADKHYQEIEESKNIEPHVALFLAFLKLFRHSQDHLNLITARHLDFFYRNVLKMTTREAEPDNVHIIFELNRNIQEQRIEKDTLLTAGKDASGNPIHYKLEDDIIINKAQVVQLRSLFKKNEKLHYALISNSKDGWGEEFDSPDAPWDLFGNEMLPEVQTGFALAAPILQLSGGIRTVNISFEISEELSFPKNISEDSFLKGFSIYGSGAKGWLGPFVANVTGKAGDLINTFDSYHKLEFSFTIPEGIEGVVPYNESVLKEHLNTGSPVVKVFLSNDARIIMDDFVIGSVKISVNVTDLSELVVENDFGPVDSSKPFMPFGPFPKSGSSMYIGSDEVFSNKITDLKLKLQWSGLPENFKSYYLNYSNGYQNRKNYMVSISLPNNKIWKDTHTSELFGGLLNSESIIPSTDERSIGFNKTVGRRALFEIKDYRPVLYKKNLSEQFGSIPMTVISKAPFQRSPLPLSELVAGKTFTPKLKEGFLRISLIQDFGHEEYFKKSAEIAAKIAAGTPGVTGQLNKPYTPLLSALKVSFTAETAAVSFLSDEESQFRNREIQFFHLLPFGHSEEHRFIKKHLDLQSSKISLAQSFDFAGELYLGLVNAVPCEQINILFQVAEGSADTELPVQTVYWSVLCKDHWKPLDHYHLIADYTNGLLRSGIITVILPKESSTDNNLLDPGYIWLRAAVRSDPASVCRAIGIHAQAARCVREKAVFDEQLPTTLESGKVTKLENEIGSVKSVSQPYSSFGGRKKESNPEYYVRVSERIRHKNRASSVWDFERIIIDRFSFVYKVKCLNHTGPSGNINPGEVTVILVPDLRNKNAVDVLKPRLSASALLEVTKYLEEFTSDFVKVYVENPDYEEIIVNARVKFRKDPVFYKKQLNEDLKKFLSPWAFQSGEDIFFTGKVHISNLIFYMEQLQYVDYVESASISRKSDQILISNMKEITPSGPKAILVSAKTHNITQL